MSNAGRPPKYTSAAELDAKINEYFSSLNPINYTLTGLCIHLDIHKDTLYEYEKNPEFSDSIKSARLKIEYSYEMKLTNQQFPTSGCIFALKNFGWKDTQEVNTNMNITGIKVQYE